MYTETVRCGTVRGELVCDVCGGGYHWTAHTALTAAKNRARADGWTVGTYHTCPECQQPKQTDADRKAYNRAYQKAQRARRRAKRNGE